MRIPKITKVWKVKLNYRNQKIAFLNSLIEDYSIILQKESEYLMSNEAIIETIEANEYEFKANGDRY